MSTSTPAMDQTFDPTATGSPVLSKRSEANFMVVPMGRGHRARKVEAEQKEDECPSTGIGMSILCSFIGIPGLELALEGLKTGLEVGESQVGSQAIVPDQNLDPRALLNPGKAFNFAKFEEPKAKVDDEGERNAKKRSWNSGEGAFNANMGARLGARRVASAPLMTMPGLRKPAPAGASSKN